MTLPMTLISVSSAKWQDPTLLPSRSRSRNVNSAKLRTNKLRLNGTELTSPTWKLPSFASPLPNSTRPKASDYDK